MKTPIVLTALRSKISRRVLLVSALYLTITVGAGELPFKGRINGSFVSQPSANPTILLSEAHATGLATHVGAFTKVTSDTVDLMTGEVEGTFTMTSANGDQVSGEYAGFIFPGATPGAFAWMLNARFTGGTGRFANATGEFVFLATGQYLVVDGIFHGSYTESFEGTIAY